ncbi:putative alpha/beta hydrolase [Mycobacterium sp. Marseille-P9652]|uniref:putative alpha/beta hydrolase n=1 Tax=Mycobacterium sp. Marseille-P9652 TaxID=2654950 RepID=UPI0012E906CF|nr:alpha/beta hydrolase [Mycobacterium sp. Marseille-P9652]
MRLRYISVPALIAEAGGDPWAIDRSLQSGRPGEIAGLAGAFRAAGRRTAESTAAFEDARRRFEASWTSDNREHGEHPINDSGEVERVTRSLGAQSEQLPKIGVDLENIAAALAEAQRTAAGEIATLEAQLQRLDDLIGLAVDQEKDPKLTAQDTTALNALVTACEDDAIADTKAALAQLRSLRGGYSDYLQRSLTTLRTDGYDPAVLGTVDAPEAPKPGDPIPLPPPGTSSEDADRWWRTLTPDQQRQMIAQHPPELGNLDGIPAEVRGEVNGAVLNDDLHTVEDVAQRHGLSPESLRDNALKGEGNDVFADPGKYGLSAADITRYQNAVKTNHGLEHDKGSVADHPRPVLLWAYDPLAYNGKGRAAIAIGNPDRSQNTAVIVPGTNSSVRGGWLYDGHNDAINLYDQSRKADPTHSTSVIAWMGYNAPVFDFQHPESAVADPAKLQQVGTPWMARAGGAVLAADVNSLAVTHDPNVASHVTVIGHSYGSTTVADAFAGSGMRANDAVLIGCPGTDFAHGAGDLHLNGGQVYVGAASTDAISWIGEAGSLPPNVLNVALGEPLGALAGLGTDPAHEGFGAVRFDAEVAGSQSVVPWFNDHSHYYDMGSESLRNMTEISTGHGNNLANEGMLAPARDEERVSTPTGVRTPLGTIPLPHVEVRTNVTVDPEWDRPSDTVTKDHEFK